MICPRCGLSNAPYAQQCARCSLNLTQPFNEQQERRSRPQNNAPMSGGSNSPLRPGQLIPIDPPSQPPSQGSAYPVSRVPSRPRPDVPANAQGGASGFWMVPGNGAASGQWDLSRSLMAPPTPSRGMQMHGAMMQHPSGQLSPGISLHNNRYRVIGYYGPSMPVTPAINQAWVAIDGARKGDRVVLVEVSLQDRQPIEANYILEVLKQRFVMITAHENVQKVLDAFSDNGRYILVFEHLEGVWLSDLVQRYGKLEESQVLRYTLAMLDVIDFLDRMTPPAVHGLISPDAYLVSTDERQIWLVNWSPTIIALALNIGSHVMPQVAPGFSTQEMQHGQFSPRDEMYSLGATMYYAVSGSAPVPRSAGLFVPVRSLNARISAATETILAKSLRVVPSQRYQDPADMRLDIERALRGEFRSHNMMTSLDPIGTGRRGLVLILSTIFSLLLITALVTGIVIHINSTSTVASTPLMPTPTVNPTAVALAKQGVGISQGEFVFNTQALQSVLVNGILPNGFTKNINSPVGAILAEQAGASDYAAGNYSSAVANFQLALNDDASNPEARIYLSNAQIAAAGTKKIITIAVVASFSGNDLGNSLQVLRGAAQAQLDLNASNVLPNGFKLKIEIGSIGSDASAIAAVSSFFVQQIQSGNKDHVVGVVSFSPSYVSPDVATNLLNGITTLQNAHVPILVPVRTSDRIPANPYFFQLSSSNMAQFGTVAQIALQVYGGHRIEVITDPSNLRNLEATQIVQQALSQKLGTYNVNVDTLDPTKNPPFQTAMNHINFYGSDEVVVIGGSNTVVGVATALNSEGLHIPIVVAPTADSPELIGQGGTDIANAALNSPQAMSQVHVIGLTDPGIWQYLNQHVPPFFTELTSTFDTPQVTITPDANAMFSYDSIHMMASTLANGGFLAAAALPSPEDMRNALAGINGKNPYAGISGVISFDASNIPINRTMVLKDIVIDPTLKDAQGRSLLDWNIRQIINGPQSFCATAAQQNTCTPND